MEGVLLSILPIHGPGAGGEEDGRFLLWPQVPPPVPFGKFQWGIPSVKRRSRERTGCVFQFAPPLPPPGSSGQQQSAQGKGRTRARGIAQPPWEAKTRLASAGWVRPEEFVLPSRPAQPPWRELKGHGREGTVRRGGAPRTVVTEECPVGSETARRDTGEIIPALHAPAYRLPGFPIKRYLPPATTEPLALSAPPPSRPLSRS